MGLGVYSDKKADQTAKDVKKKKSVGSEFFNELAGVLGADFMKTGATLYPCDVKTKDAFAKRMWQAITTESSVTVMI